MPDGWGGSWGIEPWGGVDFAAVDITRKTVTFAPTITLGAAVGGIALTANYDPSFPIPVTHSASVSLGGQYVPSFALTASNRPSIAKAASP